MCPSEEFVAGAVDVAKFEERSSQQFHWKVGIWIGNFRLLGCPAGTKWMDVLTTI